MARSGERAPERSGFFAAQFHYSADGSCILCRTGHPFAVSSSEEPSPKIEFVFSASPETIRGEPRKSNFVARPVIGRTWQSALGMILMFFPS